MSMLKFTRYAEWWEYKLVPLVSIGYAAIILNHYPFERTVERLLLLLLSVITGAIYVSVINDLTDIREDADAGKENRMANVALWQRILIVGLCLAAGICWGYLIWPDKLSLFFYAMAWVVFSVYSIPPARLKKRGIWGVFADAMGAHFFPSLLIVSNLFYISGTRINLMWAIATGVWALFYGMRGILWHQFYDRGNDILTQTKTFATRIQPENFRLAESMIFIVELATFSLVVVALFNVWILFAIVIYLVLVVARMKGLKYKTSIIITPPDAPYQLLMNDLYLALFPLALLLTITLTQRYGWALLCLHIGLFPRQIFQVMREFLLIATLTLRKLKVIQ